MKQAGITGVSGRKHWRRSKNASTRAGADLLDRTFNAEAPNQRWTADITIFGCRDGNLYLAGILDLCDRSIVGWSMGQSQNMDLVVSALVMSLSRRHPTHGVIHHSDHGCQYTSLEFSNRLQDLGLKASYGSVGDCFDNAAIEATWATMKREIRHIYGPINQHTRSDMRTIIFEYIEAFYNTQRHQTGLDNRTPAEVYASHQAA